MNDFLKNFTNNKVPPIWLMRQAGRYLPEYLQIRKSFNSFLDVCYDENKVAEITLQPIKRFNFSAAIIFSDILVLPNALGWNIRFEENIGPVLQQFKSAEDFEYLRQVDNNKLQIVYNAIAKTRALLPKNIPLIGFAGSPWTVASYLFEGKSKQDFSVSKKFIYQNRELALELISFLADQTTRHLINQIKAGANIVQLFDSWSGMLTGKEYDDFVISPTKKIVSEIRKIFPDVPIIGFPKGSGLLYNKYIDETAVDVIGVDQFVPINFMSEWQGKVVVQGNLDPVILLTDKKRIAEKVDEILLNLSKDSFIFNLGHGILPTTKIENVEFLVEYIRNFKY